MNTDAQDQWLALLRKLEREKGNAITALLAAKRQRPDLWRAWNGEKADGGQLELFSEPLPKRIEPQPQPSANA